MGIYIKDMKMPTNCDDCLLGSDCPHDQSIDGYKMQGGRPRTCPLIPAADVPPALWTDEPISGTEFMTHSQGQGGFEIHFRTDDKAKYEAVQDECRRQIGHAKPAADVRPVVLAYWKSVPHKRARVCSRCEADEPYKFADDDANIYNFCPNCGADMRLQPPKEE